MRTYVALVGVGVAALLVLSGIVGGLPSSPTALVVLLVLGVVAGRMQVRVQRQVAFSLIGVVLVASLALVGPLGAGLIGAVSFLATPFVRQRVVVVFNLLASTGLGALGGLVYLLLGGTADPAGLGGAGDVVRHLGVPLLVADLTMAVVNALLMAGVIGLTQHATFSSVVVAILRTSGLEYVGYGLLGFLLVMLWGPSEVGPLAAVLMLAPLSVARWAYIQSANELDAQERSVLALVTALDLKDPGAKARAAQVAEIAQELGAGLGLAADSLEALRYAAQLHDVGSLAEPTPLVRERSGMRFAGESGHGPVASHQGGSAAVAELLADLDFLAHARAILISLGEAEDGRPEAPLTHELPHHREVIALRAAIEVAGHDGTHGPVTGPDDEQSSGGEPDFVVVLADRHKHTEPLLAQALAAYTARRSRVALRTGGI